MFCRVHLLQAGHGVHLVVRQATGQACCLARFATNAKRLSPHFQPGPLLSIAGGIQQKLFCHVGPSFAHFAEADVLSISAEAAVLLAAAASEPPP